MDSPDQAVVHSTWENSNSEGKAIERPATEKPQYVSQSDIGSTQHLGYPIGSERYSVGDLQEALPESAAAKGSNDFGIENPWSERAWDPESQQWYSTRLRSDGQCEYHFWDQQQTTISESSEEVQIEEDDCYYYESATTTGRRRITNDGAEDNESNEPKAFVPNLDLSDGADILSNYRIKPRYSSGRRNPFCYQSPRWALYFKYISAKDISAAILAHCIQKADTKLCEKHSCNGEGSHINLGGRAAFVLYVYRGQSCIILDCAHGDLSRTQLNSLKKHSRRYTSRLGTSMEDISRAEFATAAWIDGNIPKNVFPEKVKLDSKIKCKSKNRNDKDSYAGAAICPQCGYWTPYGNSCITPNCDHSNLAPATLVAGKDVNGAGFFHPPDGQDVGLGIICLIIGGIIVGSMVQRAVRGS